jgi:hypothetical protein
VSQRSRSPFTGVILLSNEVTKRSVSTDALETLGTIITEKEKRDAIHLAVLPVVAGCKLHAGQPIDVKKGTNIAYPSTDSSLGIVDPFLKEIVYPDQMFWMVLRPRLITSLRHVWSHPSFEDELGTGSTSIDKTLARKAIEDIASECDIDADEMIQAAHEYIDGGIYLCDGGRWEGTYTPDEFWPHFEVLTGRKVPDSDRGNFFSCSC